MYVCIYICIHNYIKNFCTLSYKRDCYLYYSYSFALLVALLHLMCLVSFANKGYYY